MKRVSEMKAAEKVIGIALYDENNKRPYGVIQGVHGNNCITVTLVIYNIGNATAKSKGGGYNMFSNALVQCMEELKVNGMFKCKGNGNEATAFRAQGIEWMPVI